MPRYYDDGIEYIPSAPQRIVSVEQFDRTYPTRRNTVARTRKDALTAQIRALADELARLEDRPAEPEGAFPTVTFTMRFTAGAISYTYAARKAGNYWYTTGTVGQPPRRTWDQLLDWIDREHLGGLRGSHLAVVEATRPLVSPL